MAKKRVTYSLDEKLVKELRELSEKTFIPQSKIVEEGIKLMVKELKST